MGPWSWPALLASGLVAGALLVVLLILPRRWDVVSLVGLAVVLAVGFQAFLSLYTYVLRNDVVLVAVVLSLAMALGGYMLAAALLARHRVEPVPSAFADPDVVQADRVGVIVLAAVEPSSYSFRTVAEEFTDLADSEVPLPGDGLLPLFYAARRDSYREVGESDAPAAVRRVARRLERLLEQGDARIGPVSVALVDAAPRLDDAVADMAATGIGTVVVVSLSAGRSFKTDKALSRLDTARSPGSAMRVLYAWPSWSVGRIPELVADRIERVTHVPRPACGVVLLSAGRPEAWDRTQPDAAIEENFLVQRVRSLLADAGYDTTRIAAASIEWVAPDAGDSATMLVRRGCPQIVVAPVTIPVDGVTTLVDLKHSLHRLRRTANVETTLLPAWGDDPAVAEALASAVREAVAGL
jgi:protoheme ferro-lyase